MCQYKYYMLDDGIGGPYEIYRGESVYEFFHTSGLHRAKKDGSWSNKPADIEPTLDLWTKGDFDPEDDEISEDKALAYLAEWRAGKWPGRE